MSDRLNMHSCYLICDGGGSVGFVSRACIGLETWKPHACHFKWCLVDAVMYVAAHLGCSVRPDGNILQQLIRRCKSYLMKPLKR